MSVQVIGQVTALEEVHDREQKPICHDMVATLEVLVAEPSLLHYLNSIFSIE